MSSQNPYESPKAKIYGSDEALADHLPKVAKGQKLVINAVLAYFVLALLNGSGILDAMGAVGGILILIAVLAILGTSLWGVILLVINLNYPMILRIIVVLLMFIPLINWITLLIVNANATKVLRAGGYKVGFLGAKSPDDV